MATPGSNTLGPRARARALWAVEKGARARGPRAAERVHVNRKSTETPSDIDLAVADMGLLDPMMLATDFFCNYSYPGASRSFLLEGLSSRIWSQGLKSWFVMKGTYSDNRPVF